MATQTLNQGVKKSPGVQDSLGVSRRPRIDSLFSNNWSWKSTVPLLALVGILVVSYRTYPFPTFKSIAYSILELPNNVAVFKDKHHAEPSESLCPQVAELSPVKNKKLWDAFDVKLRTDKFKERAVVWLSGAVQISTESFDDMGPVDIDPRWEKFTPFHAYLKKSFPLIYSNLKVTRVNTYGLVYEWEGVDASLKPLLLIAHQDVVPAEPTTIDRWLHPPFSGFYDGTRIWGRGSADDKNGLISIMSAIETLLSLSFIPTRGVVLAFGFDEEASGLFGAYEINKYLETAYGRDAFSMLVDEGDGFSEQYGAVFAVPAVGEKGYMDTRVEVKTPGGHSSVPPEHTSIGILAALLAAYESRPIKPIIDRRSPVYAMMQCMAAHSPSMNSTLRDAILESAQSDKALHALETLILEYPELSNAIATTQAIDIIQGGVMSNVVPEQAWAVINHRIATQSSVTSVKERDAEIIVKFAEIFDMTLVAFGETLSNGSNGIMTLSAMWDYALEPAPVSPTNASPYEILSGTIRTAYNTHRTSSRRKEIKITPGIMAGNTGPYFHSNVIVRDT